LFTKDLHWLKSASLIFSCNIFHFNIYFLRKYKTTATNTKISSV
jgi:hypothetical protein